MTNPNLWSTTDIDTLKKLAGTMSCSEIGKLLKRTKNSVKSQINRWKLPSYGQFKPRTKEFVPEPIPVPVPVVAKAPVKPKRVSGPPLRQKPPSREYPPLEWCPECGAPVSNWEEHHQRMGHRRQA